MHNGKYQIKRHCNGWLGEVYNYITRLVFVRPPLRCTHAYFTDWSRVYTAARGVRSLPCKAKRRYLFALQVSRYCLFWICKAEVLWGLMFVHRNGASAHNGNEGKYVQLHGPGKIINQTNNAARNTPPRPGTIKLTNNAARNNPSYP